MSHPRIPLGRRRSGAKPAGSPQERPEAGRVPRGGPRADLLSDRGSRSTCFFGPFSSIVAYKSLLLQLLVTEQTLKQSSHSLPTREGVTALTTVTTITTWEDHFKF